MREVLKDLTGEQIEFVCKECGITEEELHAMDEDMLYEQVYDVMCDIECAETPSSNNPLSERCEMASELVTILGNTIEADEDEETEEGTEKTDAAESLFGILPDDVDLEEMKNERIGNEAEQ